jgi:hypothetical protein
LQILLSELVLGGPTTIESGEFGKELNFYSLTMAMDYGMAYPWEGLEVAAKNGGDCTKHRQQTSQDEYTPCAHAILEIWNGFEQFTDPLTEHGMIKPRSFIGIIGEEAWWMPKYTSIDDLSLLSWSGLAGEDNRERLAQRFK